MTHRFPIKEIALQAGLSTATIDRALNKRSHVSPQTQARVAAAISELEAQESQMSARGRRMFFDFVIEAPTRFSREVRQAAEQVVGQVSGTSCRLRFVAQEMMSDIEITKILTRIAKRGSQGVCLKARDTAQVRGCVEMLHKAGIPVVTLVTDIRDAHRIAYIGLDNESAGQTAAYLTATALGDAHGTVLALRSNENFLGEEQRARAFAEKLSELCPSLRLVALSGGSGVHFETARLLSGVVGNLEDICAVYSMGGGNRAVLDVLEQSGHDPTIYIAHDLDRDNRQLLSKGSENFVLHHDLRLDMQNVLQALLHHHRLVAEGPRQPISSVQVITPMNVPPVHRD